MLLWTGAIAQQAGTAPRTDQVSPTSAGAASEPAAKPGDPESPAPPSRSSARNQTVVTSTRLPMRRDEQPRALTVVGQDDLVARSTRSVPEALSETEGVYVQKTNPGGGTPIIRGLYGQQVLLLVDGIRINNATLRAGPNQYLNTVDPFLVDQIEVLRGPGSVLYGSDALGGVINVRTFWPKFSSEPKFGGLLSGRAASYDLSLQGHLRSTASSENSAAAVSVTGRDFNDLRGGAAIGLQPYTGYEEWDASAKLRHRFAPGKQLFFQYQLMRQADAPRLDKSTPGDFRRFTNQFRDLIHARYEQSALGPLSQVSVELSGHRQGDLTQRFRIARDRIENDFASNWTWGGRAEASTRPSIAGVSPTVTFGLDAFYDRVNGAASRVAISDRTAYTQRPTDTRYLYISQALSSGLFARAFTDPVAPLSGYAGLRGQLNNVSLPEDRRLNALFPSTPVLPAANVFNAGAAAEAGLTYRPASDLSLLLNLGSGFRSPNIDDYSRLGVEGPGFLVPSRDLGPEQSYTAELGVRYAHPRAQAEAFYAFTTVHGLIGNVPTTFEGSAVNPDGVPYITRQNRERADLHSGEIAVELFVLPQLSLFSNATILFAEQFRKDLLVEGEPLLREPLARMPPFNGTVRLRYTPLQWIFTEAVVRWAAAQREMSASDRLDIRICAEVPNCNGTDGYVAFHLRAGASIGERFNVGLSLLNLLDATYRIHGSGVDEPGRSVALSLEARL